MSAAERVRQLLERPTVERATAAARIALEALEQYNMAAPYPAGQATRASLAIERMADALEGKP